MERFGNGADLQKKGGSVKGRRQGKTQEAFVDYFFRVRI
jgi:hypothetical protein